MYKKKKNKTCFLKKKKTKKQIRVRRVTCIIRKPRIIIIAPKIQCPAEPASVSIVPCVQRYYYIPDSDIYLTDIKTFTASQFLNDAGDPVYQFTEYGQNGYFNLFINAVLQQGQLYSVNPSVLTIQPTWQTIKAGTPIILESVGFTAEVQANH